MRSTGRRKWRQLRTDLVRLAAKRIVSSPHVRRFVRVQLLVVLQPNCVRARRLRDRPAAGKRDWVLGRKIKAAVRHDAEGVCPVGKGNSAAEIEVPRLFRRRRDGEEDGPPRRRGRPPWHRGGAALGPRMAARARQRAESRRRTAFSGLHGCSHVPTRTDSTVLRAQRFAKNV